MKTGSVTGDQVTTAPTLSENDTKVSFSVNLKKPGEYYEFTIDAVNNGTLDAMIEDIDFDVDNGGSLPAYLDFSVTYEDDIPLFEKQLLKAAATNENVETYKVRVEFKKDITSDDLVDDENGETVVCTLDVSYVQADNTAHEVRYYASVSDKTYILGQPVPEGATVYHTETEATTTYRTLVKYALDKDGKVATVFVGAKGEDNHYYYYPSDSYEMQKELNNQIYSSNDCEEKDVETFLTFLSPFENHKYTYCNKNDGEWETTVDSMKMIVFVANNGYGCCLFNNQLACKDVNSLYSFVGYVTP